jgi:proteasome lid subunit RPN8/RPN11
MLRINQTGFEEIRRHGEETYPHECCGILLGTIDRHGDRDTRVVKSTMRAGNTRNDRPQDRFNIDPADIIRAQKLARDRMQDIVGFYHSHPDCPAQWSQTDLAEAHWIGCSYVITSVRQGQAERTNSFALLGTLEEDKHFEDERLEVTPTVAVAMAREKPA